MLSERRTKRERIKIFLVVKSRVAGIAVCIGVSAANIQPALKFVIKVQSNVIGRIAAPAVNEIIVCAADTSDRGKTTIPFVAPVSAIAFNEQEVTNTGRFTETLGGIEREL